jgi:hypothetical protein
MKVVVDRVALKNVIQKLVSEDRSIHTTRIDVIAGNSEDVEMSDENEDQPIHPNPQMATQLSVDRPPVEDPDFVPGTIEELSRSASVLAMEVPDDQIDFFYRSLHELLDRALDEHDKKKYDISENFIRSRIKRVLKEVEEMTDEDEERIFSSIANTDPIDTVLNSMREFEDRIFKARKEAVFSVSPDVLDHIDELYDWMFYPKDSEQFMLPQKVLKIIERPEVKGAFRDALKATNMSEEELKREIIRRYRALQPAPEKSLQETPSVAAEMYSNVQADKIMKSVEGDADKFISKFDDLIRATKESNMSTITVKFAERTGEPPLKIDIPIDMYISALESVREERASEFQKAREKEEEVEVEPEVDVKLLQKQAREREKTERQQLADELGTTYGALTNIEQDMAVALGPRIAGAKMRAPRRADPDKLGMLKKIYVAIFDKLSSEISREVVAPKFAEMHNLTGKLSPEERKIINQTASEITSEIFGFDKENLSFTNKDAAEIARQFVTDFVKQLDKDLTGPFFDALPDYADFKTGDMEFEARTDFTPKDLRETRSTAKNIAYLIRNIFNVGYELEAMSQKLKMDARQAGRSGDSKASKRLRMEAEEYENESSKYMTRPLEILAALKETEVSPKVLRKYISPMEAIVNSLYSATEEAQ